MNLTKFNETIKSLGEFFDGTNINMRTVDNDKTIVRIEDKKSDYVICELYFDNTITVENDGLTVYVDYSYANYFINELSEAELSAVKAIIAMFEKEN